LGGISVGISSLSRRPLAWVGQGGWQRWARNAHAPSVTFAENGVTPAQHRYRERRRCSRMNVSVAPLDVSIPFFASRATASRVRHRAASWAAVAVEGAPTNTKDAGAGSRPPDLAHSHDRLPTDRPHPNQYLALCSPINGARHFRAHYISALTYSRSRYHCLRRNFTSMLG